MEWKICFPFMLTSNNFSKYCRVLPSAIKFPFSIQCKLNLTPEHHNRHCQSTNVFCGFASTYVHDCDLF